MSARQQRDLKRKRRKNHDKPEKKRQAVKNRYNTKYQKARSKENLEQQIEYSKRRYLESSEVQTDYIKKSTTKRRKDVTRLRNYFCK